VNDCNIIKIAFTKELRADYIWERKMKRKKSERKRKKEIIYFDNIFYQGNNSLTKKQQ
jgi:hypothetical protein